MSNFTIERRQFILGAVLAPFASQFAEAGVKPRSSFTEYVIGFQTGGDEFHISIADDGNVEEVFYHVREKVLRMNEKPLATLGDLCGSRWVTYACESGPHKAEIRFRANGNDLIDIDWLMAIEQLT